MASRLGFCVPGNPAHTLRGQVPAGAKAGASGSLGTSMWGRPVLWLHPVTKEASSPAPPAAPGPVAPWPLCPTGECQGLQGPGGPTLGPLPPVGTGSSRALISVWGCFSGESEQTAGLRQVWANRGGPLIGMLHMSAGQAEGTPRPWDRGHARALQRPGRGPPTAGRNGLGAQWVSGLGSASCPDTDGCPAPSRPRLQPG